ncbi:hypothetical protein BKA61DRAFT_481605, partial [Leptodontidium sp. MPI-SDFR-AT-0119]
STKCALLDNRNYILTKINNEVKVRRSIKSLVLGKAKVINFKNIKVARAARATKDIIKEKGKRSRKYKSVTLKVSEPHFKPEYKLKLKVARVTKEFTSGREKRNRKRKTTI